MYALFQWVHNRNTYGLAQKPHCLNEYTKYAKWSVVFLKYCSILCNSCIPLKSDYKIAKSATQTPNLRVLWPCLISCLADWSCCPCRSCHHYPPPMLKAWNPRSAQVLSTALFASPESASGTTSIRSQVDLQTWVPFSKPCFGFEKLQNRVFGFGQTRDGNPKSPVQIAILHIISTVHFMIWTTIPARKNC